MGICQKGFPVEQGFDIVLYGNIPNGSGLSSSASVETVTGVMLRDMFGYDTISMIDIALYGQFSENNYNGVNCRYHGSVRHRHGQATVRSFLTPAI